MRAHAAVYTLLSEDYILKPVYGINASRVWNAQAVDTVPRGGPFLILRWEDETMERGGFGRREHLTVWAHQAREAATDYTKLNEILDRVQEILANATHVSGSDGTLCQVVYNGRSPEFSDEGYKTITRNAAFLVSSR